MTMYKFLHLGIKIYIVVILTVGCTVVSENPNIQPINSTAIYEESTENIKHIHAVQVQDGSQSLITSVEAGERYSLSPSGKHLIIYYGKELRLIDIVSGEAKLLATDLTWPRAFGANIDHKFVSWSEDGDKLAILASGPDLGDGFYSATEILLVDVQTQSITYTYNNGTWINEVAWSENAKSIAFPELSIPCADQGLCTNDTTTTYLTTLSFTEEQSWQKEYSRRIKESTDSLTWRSLSLCELAWSPSGQFISYKQDCELGVISQNSNIYIESIDGQYRELLPPLQESDSRNINLKWLENDRLIVFVRENFFREDASSHNSITLFQIEKGHLEIIVQEQLNQFEIDAPASNDVLLYDSTIYAISKLKDGKAILVAFGSQSAKTQLLDIPDLATSGLWGPEGYLTQSQQRIVLVDLDDGSWEILQEDIPTEYRLIGWLLN